jgi:hypothetical protein
LESQQGAGPAAACGFYDGQADPADFVARTAMPSPSVQDRCFVAFDRTPSQDGGNPRRWLTRARDFSVEWIQIGADAAPCGFASAAETLVLVARGAAHLQPQAPLAQATVPADAVAILPAGAYALSGAAGALCAVIASQRADLPDLVPIAAPRHRRRTPLAALQILRYVDIRASAEKPRLKMLQTDTLSINIVDYIGPRDRAALSPHSHADFEQGSLALAGDFVHHLRTPWGADADRWRDDEHLQAPSPSMLVIPPQVIHTSEGVGEGRHVLIDVFSPPRADFIASNWVFNAGDYEALPRP